MRCIRMELGEPDASGRPRPVPKPGSEFDVEATAIIAAISQEPDFDGFVRTARRAGLDQDRTTGAPPPSTAFTPAATTSSSGWPRIAISQGRFAAEAIDARFRGKPLAKDPAPAAHHDRQNEARAGTRKRSGTIARTCRRISAASIPRSSSGLTEDEALDEAKRCMSCGMCMDCETCWMYCTNSCFVKLPKGEHYRVKLEVCNGCKKCAEQCPCGYIDIELTHR